MARCPLIRKCASKVAFQKYTEVCANLTADKYLECEDFKKATSGSKTPLEWDRLVSAV